MPYTSNPSGDTYSTEKIDLTNEISLRQGAIGKDEDYLNVIYEFVQSKPLGDTRRIINKRAGTSQFLSGSGVIRGCFYWDSQQKFVYCIDTHVYCYSFNTGTTTSLDTFVSTAGVVGFVEFQSGLGVESLIASDGTRLVSISTTNVLTICTDADLPTPHDPNIVTLDGYIFLVKYGTADIYNSDNDAPLSWTASDPITAEIEADKVVRLAKINNYLVALGNTTIEYFWDAGNATGSPLNRNDTPIKNITYISGLAQYGNNLYFIGKYLNGDIHVFKMSDFKVEPISTPSISRYLNSSGIPVDQTIWRGNVVSFQGHTYYALCVGALSWFCDLDQTNYWFRMAFQQNTNFDIQFAVTITASQYPKMTMFNLFDSSGTWYRFDNQLLQDNGTNFSCVITTPNSDFGTSRRKMMYNLFVDSDRPSAASNVLIQWSDDDYQTFNTGINLNLDQDLASIRQLGSFRQRAFKLTHTDNTVFRIMGLSVDINKGAS